MIQMPDDLKALFTQSNVNSVAKNIVLRFYDTPFTVKSSTTYLKGEIVPDALPFYTVTNKNIESESMKINNSLFDTENLSFGECTSAKFEITLANIGVDFTGTDVFVSLQIGKYEISLGVYTVDSYVRQADRYKRVLTAYDYMRKFQKDVTSWYNDLTFPMTLKAFRESLCNYVEIGYVTMNLPQDSLSIEKTIDPQGLTGLDVIKAICEINATFGNINSNGLFQCIYLANPDDWLLPSLYLYPSETLYPKEIPVDPITGQELSIGDILLYDPSNTTYEDYAITGIERVQIRLENGDIGYTYGTGTNTYVIESNFLTYGKDSETMESIAESIFNKVNFIKYTPCSISAPYYPWLECGDIIGCRTTDAEIITYVVTININGIQHLFCDYSATGTLELEENTGIQKEITNLKGKSAIILKTVEEVSIKLTDLEKSTNAKFTQTAESITAEVIRATKAEGTLSSLITQTAESITIEVNKKVAEDDLIKTFQSKLDITGNSIDLKTGHFTVSANNFTLNSDGVATLTGINIANVEANGKTVFSVDDKGNVTSNTFYAKNIAEGATGHFSVLLAERASFNTSLVCSGEAEFSGETTFADITQSGTANMGKINAYGDMKVYGQIKAYDYVYFSDRRLKENIKLVNTKDAISVILKSQPVTYNFIENAMRGMTAIKQVGFIAQDVEEIQGEFPLTGELDNYKTLSYTSYIPLLVSAVKYLLEKEDSNDGK